MNSLSDQQFDLKYKLPKHGRNIMCAFDAPKTRAFYLEKGRRNKKIFCSYRAPENILNRRSSGWSGVKINIAWGLRFGCFITRPLLNKLLPIFKWHFLNYFFMFLEIFSNSNYSRGLLLWFSLMIWVVSFIWKNIWHSGCPQ